MKPSSIFFSETVLTFWISLVFNFTMYPYLTQKNLGPKRMQQCMLVYFLTIKELIWRWLEKAETSSQLLFQWGCTKWTCDCISCIYLVVNASSYIMQIYFRLPSAYDNSTILMETAKSFQGHYGMGLCMAGGPCTAGSKCNSLWFATSLCSRRSFRAERPTADRQEQKYYAAGVTNYVDKHKQYTHRLQTHITLATSSLR